MKADNISEMQSGKRLAFLDSLRGIAVLSVFLCHGLGYLSPKYLAFSASVFDFGAFGVLLFFICSGFIIPASLERYGSLWGFWTSRIFRLYPLYWLNIGLWLTLVNSHYPAHMVLANMTMLQPWLGSENLVHLYWTLTVEMLFYLIVSVIFAAGVLRWPVPFALGFLSVGALAGGGILSYLGMMFVGMVFYRLYTGEANRLTTALVVAYALATGASGTLGHGGIGLFTAQLGACALFAAQYRARGRRHLGFLLYMGVISYSFYLMHLLVFAVLVPETGIPFLTLVLWLGLSVLVSSLTYYIVERPGIASGRRLITALEGVITDQPVREVS